MCWLVHLVRVVSVSAFISSHMMESVNNNERASFTMGGCRLCVSRQCRTSRDDDDDNVDDFWAYLAWRFGVAHTYATEAIQSPAAHNSTSVNMWFHHI